MQCLLGGEATLGATMRDPASLGVLFNCGAGRASGQPDRVDKKSAVACQRGILW